jgi:hemerythrin superfamily protein
MTQHKTTSSSKSKTNDIIKLLKADHAKVKALFDEFEELKGKNSSNSKKEKIVKQICEELTLHALAEESIVYPVAREEMDDDDLMDEADVEHAGAKELISQLESMSAEDSHYDAKVTVLREYIEHHVKEEEDNMFPKLTESEIDGSEMAKEVIHFKENHKDSGSKGSSKSVNQESNSKSAAARTSNNKDEKNKSNRKT